MSNFEKVVDFNHQFGVLQNKDLRPRTRVFEEDPSVIQRPLDLIREEMKELEDAVKEKDFKEVVDALTDILYVVYGMGARLGINMDEAFQLVHENNMSKLCRTETEARCSVEHYAENKEKFGYDSPQYRPAPDGKHWVVYNASTHKVLKSVLWKPVDLTSVISDS